MIKLTTVRASACTCEHGTKVGATGSQHHPVCGHFHVSRHQLDVTQHLFTGAGGEKNDRSFSLDKTTNIWIYKSRLQWKIIYNHDFSANVASLKMRTGRTMLNALILQLFEVKWSVTHLLRSFISWKAFLMCVWLTVRIPPLAVSSSASLTQFGCAEAGEATRLVRDDGWCSDYFRC